MSNITKMKIIPRGRSGERGSDGKRKAEGGREEGRKGEREIELTYKDVTQRRAQGKLGTLHNYNAWPPSSLSKPNLYNSFSLSFSLKPQGPFLCWNLCPEPFLRRLSSPTSAAFLSHLCGFLNKLSRII